MVVNLPKDLFLRVFSQYATVFPLCSSENTFETASELALSSFNRSLEGGNYDAFLDSCDVKSPLSESCNALQQLLRSCPAHFSAPTAMNALESKCLPHVPLDIPFTSFSL